LPGFDKREHSQREFIGFGTLPLLSVKHNATRFCGGNAIEPSSQNTPQTRIQPQQNSGPFIAYFK